MEAKKRNNRKSDAVDLIGMFCAPGGMNMLENEVFLAYIEDMEKLEEFFEADSIVTEEKAKKALETMEDILEIESSWEKDRGISMVVKFQTNKESFLMELRQKIRERAKIKRGYLLDMIVSGEI